TPAASRLSCARDAFSACGDRSWGGRTAATAVCDTRRNAHHLGAGSGLQSEGDHAMTCRRAMPSTLAMVAALALAPPAVLGARQQTTGGQRGPASTGPSKPAQKVPPKARTTGGIPQGFSVVLVVGDLQGAPGDGDVPPAARQALNDMKDFLPY